MLDRRKIDKSIVAIDPANVAGWAVVGGFFGPASRYGTWNIASPGDTHRGARLGRFARLLAAKLDAAPCGLVVYEDAGFAARGQLKVAAMHSELRGLICYFAYRRGIPALAVNPTTLKKWATGKGNAKKDQMIDAAVERFGLVFDDDNQADAIWLLEYGLAHGATLFNDREIANGSGNEGETSRQEVRSRRRTTQAGR